MMFGLDISVKLDESNKKRSLTHLHDYSIWKDGEIPHKP